MSRKALDPRGIFSFLLRLRTFYLFFFKNRLFIEATRRSFSDLVLSIFL